METGKQPERSGGAYLCFQTVGEGREEWAALLVVTAGGLPQEFLYSGPIRPTPVQAILYQHRLAPEVRLSLVRSLLRGLRSRPAFIAFPAGEADAETLRELSLPVLLLDGETGTWAAEPGPAAEKALRRLEDVVGAAEPLGRAAAAWLSARSW